ncbi:hypothetical protein AMATHDRAFT_87514 [Amanita thiersii Skay4041]|uniref:Cytochrome P450 n=1 Tax=Amanita thiersii Skay4041 TaxID=703135 RepID=A0A2A9NHM1_9AGAR|nr:hypothetical protein AMATHDRAFT_87514 [Amanita thiersii Skay4041]
MDALFLFLACVFFLLYNRWRRRISSHVSLPPGPKGWPIFGCRVPHDHAWLTYTEWAKDYGDIIYLQTLGQPLVILNSLKVINDLFEKRSTIYSDRPRMIMANELMGWDWDLVHMPYSDRWRQHRRVFHQQFQSRAIPEYHPVLRHAAANFVLNLFASPKDFRDHIRQLAGGIVLRVVYGYDVKSKNDDYIKLMKKAVEPLLQVVHAGTYLVEYLPALKYIPSWFPGAKFKKDALQWSVFTQQLREQPFGSVEKSMASGAGLPCFISKQLEKAEATGDPTIAEVAKNCAGIAYAAGSDTTVSLIESWFLAMVLYPEAQARARKELETVIGPNRLPDFPDRSALPYIDAMLLETLRWNPPTPLGVPHRALHDDIYENHYIPKGATVIGNNWAITRDEELYPEPERFMPERFLSRESKEGHGSSDPVAGGAFGFGRRICPGRHLAMDSAWLTVVYLLLCYEIARAVDDTGKEIIPRVDNISGIVVHPKPYELRLIPRSKESMNFIHIVNEDNMRA